MKRFFLLLVLSLPLAASAQKLTESAIDDISTKMAATFLKLNDPALVFVTEQMSRTGAGGLEIDKTMQDLKKDPATIDAALKFLYQYSDCDRQTFITNLRAMDIKSGNVFPIATYTVNKYKNEAKELIDEKGALYKSGAIPKAITLMVAPPANMNQATAANLEGTPPAAAQATQQAAGAPATINTTAAGVESADTRNWDVRLVFGMTKPDQLLDLYGKQNVELRDATDFDGNDAGKAWVVYPDTENEMAVVFYKDSTKTITFGQENAKWRAPFGIKPGDPVDKVQKVNGRGFRINGFEWTNGGTVQSFDGGQLDNKGVHLLFRALNTGDPKLYDSFTGEKSFRSDASGVKKLGVIVEKVQFRTGN
ncbi:hypothetical protein WJU16_09375 [Chitinophaga pollutisoli]|uniref:Uncharacterized protein n=1 Tax=Chitinophaga pollutisoli TaxID=3133966 RepID=A0ABZ2YWP4_9BACT